MNIKTIALITATVLGGGSLLATNNTYADTLVTIPFEEVNMCNAAAEDIGSDKIEENNCSDETNPSIIMTDSNIESITELHLNNRNISNITGIEYFTNLTNLYLEGNQITDLTPLKDLTSLTGLHLDNNQITDLTPLKDLTSLTHLDLDRNQITDLTPLKDLTSLTHLDLDRNQITDITPLKDLTSLTNLSLYENQITDLTPLSNLISLINLDLRENQISDLTPLSNLTSLTDLNLRDNQISDLTPMANLKSLYDLAIANNPLLDISPILNLHLSGVPFFDDPPIIISFDTTNNKQYVLPSVFQFLNAKLDTTPVADWVDEGQEMIRQMLDAGMFGFGLQNATMNEDGKSITILDTSKPVIIDFYATDGVERMSMALLTVTYEEPVDPDDPTDDPTVPNTGKNTKESNTATLTAILCILSGIVLTAIPMTRLYFKNRKIVNNKI